jgi:hypothetical protein
MLARKNRAVRSSSFLSSPFTDMSSSAAGRRTQRNVTQPSQPTQATPPFPTGGVPGTHPESGQQPSASMNLDPTPEAGPSGTAASAANSQEGEDSAPSQPRKLKRRAKTGRTAFDDLFDDVGTSTREETSRSSNRPHTQDLGGATLASTEAGPSGAMDVEPVRFFLSFLLSSPVLTLPSPNSPLLPILPPRLATPRSSVVPVNPTLSLPCSATTLPSGGRAGVDRRSRCTRTSCAPR